MSIVRFIINPRSSFVSFPKGDMLFGHFAAMLFMQNDKRLQNYLEQRPPIIFSDFLPNGYLPRPSLPMDSFGIRESEKKEFRKKEWIPIEALQDGDLTQLSYLQFIEIKTVTRNSINRNTLSTDDSGPFAPYAIEELEFHFQPVVYAFIDETIFSIDEVKNILNLIGKSGFGKKSSIGKGSFEVRLDEKFEGFKAVDTNYYLTISPTFLNVKNIEKAYYDLFHRFGKYSFSNTPFKKPVLLANSGAVVKMKEPALYVGKALSNATVAPSFVQGYSIAIPFQFDGKGVEDVR